MYAPDARLLPPGSPPVTGDGIEQFWRAALDQGLDGGVLKTVSLEERDGLAIEEGHFELRVGGAVVDNGSYLVLHRRQTDGSWRYAIDIWNSDQTPSTS